MRTRLWWKKYKSTSRAPYGTCKTVSVQTNIQRVKIPFPVETGAHEIRINVTSENSYPAVIAYSETLPMKTGKEWSASLDGKNWRIAAPASRIEQLTISKRYPSSLEALAAVWPYLTIVFFMVFLFPYGPVMIKMRQSNIQTGSFNRLTYDG